MLPGRGTVAGNRQGHLLHLLLLHEVDAPMSHGLHGPGEELVMTLACMAANCSRN